MRDEDDAIYAAGLDITAPDEGTATKEILGDGGETMYMSLSLTCQKSKFFKNNSLTLRFLCSWVYVNKQKKEIRVREPCLK